MKSQAFALASAVGSHRGMPPSSALDTFVASLTEASPPAGAEGPLLGVWHALRGNWDAAHDAVQDDSRESAWVHAVLHREEGDHANAGYWYRRAGRKAGSGALRDEYLQVAADLLAG